MNTIDMVLLSQIAAIKARLRGGNALSEQYQEERIDFDDLTPSEREWLGYEDEGLEEYGWPEDQMA